MKIRFKIYYRMQSTVSPQAQPYVTNQQTGVHTVDVRQTTTLEDELKGIVNSLTDDGLIVRHATGQSGTWYPFHAVTCITWEYVQ